MSESQAGKKAQVKVFLSAAPRTIVSSSYCFGETCCFRLQGDLISFCFHHPFNNTSNLKVSSRTCMTKDNEFFFFDASDCFQTAAFPIPFLQTSMLVCAACQQVKCEVLCWPQFNNHISYVITNTGVCVEVLTSPSTNFIETGSRMFIFYDLRASRATYGFPIPSERQSEGFCILRRCVTSKYDCILRL